MSVEKKIPMRKCIGCDNMKPKKEMVRVVRTEDQTFVLDDTGKLNGRGAYLCKCHECLEKAKKGHGLERSFQQKISSDLYDTLSEEMSKFEKQ